MLNGTLVISYDCTPRAASIKAVLAQLATLPSDAFPLVLCGFDREACLAISVYLDDVCYNMYDYLACNAEVFRQTDTLPYIMLVGGGTVRHFSAQNSTKPAAACATLKAIDMKEVPHAPRRCTPPHSSCWQCQPAIGS